MLPLDIAECAQLYTRSKENYSEQSSVDLAPENGKD